MQEYQQVRHPRAPSLAKSARGSTENLARVLCQQGRPNGIPSNVKVLSTTDPMMVMLRAANERLVRLPSPC